MVSHSSRSSSVRALQRAILRKYREVGVAGLLKLSALKLMRIIHNLVLFRGKYADPFDLKYGTDTGGIIHPWALDIPDDMRDHAVQYRTAIVEVFMDILNGLPISHEEFVFVDLGSGKGRALLLASQFPFRQIMGVELSPSLHTIASHNIHIYRDPSQRCHKIESVCLNAVNFEIPKEKVVFYLFNPFDEQVIDPVLSNIKISLEICPKDIFIIYLKPVYRYLFDQASFLILVTDNERYAIYRSKTI